MYKRNAQGWLKHFDFYIVDEIALQLAFIIAALVRMGDFAYSLESYRALALSYAVIDLLMLMLFDNMHNVMKRGYFKEMMAAGANSLAVFAAVTMGLFTLQEGQTFSRVAIYLTLLFHFLLSYGGRLLWKLLLKKLGAIDGGKGKMLAVLHSETAENMLERMLKNSPEGYDIEGLILDKATSRRDILGVPVVAALENASDYISGRWLDAVYIDCAATDPRVRKLMSDCGMMGIPVHYHVPAIGGDGNKRFVEKICGTTVLTSSINYMTPVDNFLKRCLDILGGLAGSLMALIIIAVVGPKIKKASPGPILYSQERIGKNGKRFKMYKIRSMYLDADERKKELMAQNRVKDGMMFKLDWDPRIIGNVELPDGTRKTGIGEFIRKTSLDEFPQFFNVLAGQMSLVGTRPPTVDEWEKYEYHHRARLACKPGITGMWQTSGRSEITDFEEVVRLDTEYISNWTLGLDIKILFKTVTAVLKGKGAM